MAREVNLWTWIKAGLKGAKGLHMRRVENRVGNGDPDMDGCYNGVYFEVELKGCNRPVRNGPLVFEVRDSQVAWHHKRLKAKGNTWLYIRVGKASDIRRYLLSGSNIACVKDAQDMKQCTEDFLSGLAVLPPRHTAQDFLAKVTSTQKIN
jgi:hypothetical protein